MIPASRRQPSSMRLIFEYDGDEVRLVMQQPVDALVTGFDITRTQREGYYVDTRDASGGILARVPARGAFQSSVEVFPERPGEPITRTDCERPRGAFTVIVPVPQNADHVQDSAGHAGAARCDAAQRSRPQASPGSSRGARTRSGFRFASADKEKGHVHMQMVRSWLDPNIWRAPRNRAFNVVLLAEGFTAAQQAAFNTACGNFVTAFPQRRRSTN